MNEQPRCLCVVWGVSAGMCVVVVLAVVTSWPRISPFWLADVSTCTYILPSTRNSNSLLEIDTEPLDAPLLQTLTHTHRPPTRNRRSMWIRAPEHVGSIEMGTATKMRTLQDDGGPRPLAP